MDSLTPRGAGGFHEGQALLPLRCLPLGRVARDLSPPLVARRDVGGPFDQMRPELTFSDQQTFYNAAYWGRAKRTALYKIDKQNKKVVWLKDLPFCGDTSFPAIARLDAHRFLIANYTSPLDDLDISWVKGQTQDKGTRIYLTTLELKATP